MTPRASVTPFRDGPPTDPAVEMFDPVLFPPPRNQLLLIATKGGITTKGFWNDEDCIAWMYHPKIPASVKERQRMTTQQERNH